MRSDRWNYVVAGGFVLASLVGIVVLLAVLAGRTGATDTYTVEFRNVTGLGRGTQVLFEGYPVGQIEGIRAVPGARPPRFEVELAVRRGWPIPEDSVAEITAPGLLAAFALQIHAGTSSVLLEPGSRLRADDGPPIFELVSGVAEDLGRLAETEIKPLLAALGERAPSIIENLEELSNRMNDLALRVEQILSRENTAAVGKILANVDATSQSLAELARELDGTARRMDGLLAEVEGMVVENREEVGRAVRDLRFSLETVASHVESINQNLEGASRNMNEFARIIRSNPGLLLNGRAPSDEEP